MPSKRMGRVNEDVKRELADILRGLKDPRIATMVTVVRTEVSGDLSYAKIFVSVMGDEAATKTTLQGLASANGYIRRELAARLKLRKTPELKFIADGSIAHGAHIAQILQSLDIPAEEDATDEQSEDAK